MFLTGEKSLIRKMREIIITYRLEATLKKEEILERYLNVVEFGQGLYGIKAASQYYFKESAVAVECAGGCLSCVLAPQSRKAFTSFRKGSLSPYAKKRVLQIVERMFLFDYVTFDNYQFGKVNLDRFPWHGPLEDTSAAQPSDQADTKAAIMKYLKEDDSSESAADEDPKLVLPPPKKTKAPAPNQSEELAPGNKANARSSEARPSPKLHSNCRSDFNEAASEASHKLRAKSCSVPSEANARSSEARPSPPPAAKGFFAEARRQARGD